MKLRKDKASAAAPQLKVMTGGQPLAPPTPGTAAGQSDQGVLIPDRLTQTFRVTSGGTDAVMAVVMVRGDINDLLGAYDRYEMSVDERGGPDAGLILHVCSPTADGICVMGYEEPL